MGSKKLAAHDYSALIDRIIRRVQTRTAKSLSYAGRMEIIRSILFSMNTYWCNALLIPNSLVLEIDVVDQKLASHLAPTRPTGSTHAQTQWQSTNFTNQLNRLSLFLMESRDAHALQDAALFHGWLFTNGSPLLIGFVDGAIGISTLVSSVTINCTFTKSILDAVFGFLGITTRFNNLASWNAWLNNGVTYRSQLVQTQRCSITFFVYYTWKARNLTLYQNKKIIIAECANEIVAKMKAFVNINVHRTRITSRNS
ncbi:hypothetical protein V2J09_017061 [Rumex salicifolius]